LNPEGYLFSISGAEYGEPPTQDNVFRGFIAVDYSANAMRNHGSNRLRKAVGV
jgi:hypothetical protein